VNDRIDDTLAAIVQIATNLRSSVATHRALELDMLPAELRASAGNASGRGGVSDPTGQLAVALTAAGVDTIPRSWADFLAHADTALVHLRKMQTRQATVLRENPARARDAEATLRALRCDGELDPLCTRNAVRAGKCWRCYREALNRTDDTMRATSTPGVVPSVSIGTSARAATVVGTCGRCGAQIPGTTRSHVRDLLAEHHATACPARG
jgi:hypothetical protein